MNRRRLNIALEKALTSAPTSTFPPSLRELNFWMYGAHSGSPQADPNAVRLLKVLQLEPALTVFNGQFMHVVAHSANPVEYWHLAAWLVSRAQSVGSHKAISYLARYLRAAIIPYDVVIVITGLGPDKTYKMGPNISFLPWDDLRITMHKQSVHERYVIGGTPGHWPTGALVQRQESGKQIVPNAEYDPAKYAGGVLDAELYDCFLCLAVVEPSAPQILAVWAETPEWSPVFPGSMSLQNPLGLPRQTPLLSDGHKVARKLYKNFASASHSLQTRLRLVIPRLIRAGRHPNVVDTAVDLGIALEALYLSDKSPGELNYRLRTRAARYLGDTKANRRKISDQLGKVYDLRSKAVHSGDPKHMKVKNATPHQILQEGISVAAQTARCFINNGEPDWDDLMFE